VNVTPKAGMPSNAAALIGAALVAWGITNASIGGGVILTDLYSPINSIGPVGSFSVSSLLIGTTALNVAAADLTIPYNGVAIISAANIVVNIAT
jgi:hypothetical protein